MNQISEKIKSRDEAISSLPSPYQPVDDNFLEENKKAIDILRETYKDKGGIHRLVADNDLNVSIICKVPDSALMEKSKTQSQRLTSSETDDWLVKECLLYPSPQEFDGWLKKGQPGLGASFVTKIIHIAKFTSEVKAKKL